MLLRKLFSSGGSSSTPHANNTAANTSAANQLASTDAAKSSDASSRAHDEDASGFPQLVSRLEDFEGRLQSAINVLSRHCQAITEVSFSCKSLGSGLQDMYGGAVESLLQYDQQQQQQQQDAGASSWIPLIAEFRTSTIAPLQAILADIPQLKVFCEHRNSALVVKARYDKKIEEIQSATRYESARLQRNRAKQVAAAVRFREIDDKVRADIARLLARDLGDLLGDSVEKILLDAQALAAKRLEANARELRERIETLKAARCTPATSAAATRDDAKTLAPSEPEDVDTTTAPLALAPPIDDDVVVATAGIRILPQHVLSEDRSVCPRKKHAFGTRTWDVHRHIKDSLATGLDVAECVQLPEGYELTEWVAVHVVDFFNEISLLYGTIAEFCTATTCPQMTAGPCYTYLWADGKQQVAPLALAASAYVDRLLAWVQSQLDDPLVFPLDGASAKDPATFLRDAAVVLKRLFRVYAHMYHSHVASFAALHAESHLNFCFKRFVLFVTAFDLVDQKELNALRKLIQTLVAPGASSMAAGASHGRVS